MACFTQFGGGRAPIRLQRQSLMCSIVTFLQMQRRPPRAHPDGLRRRTWSNSRCYENPECAARSSASTGAGHTRPDRLTLHEPELHTLKTQTRYSMHMVLET